MIKLMGIAKGLSPKKIVKEAMETQELAEEYAKDIENMITQIDDFEDEMTQELNAQKQQTGEVQELSYTELRARLPQEISNDIVMLLANSKQALLDFANIQTTEDIASFNQQYDVNLSMPSGA